MSESELRFKGEAVSQTEVQETAREVSISESFQLSR